MSDTSPLPSPGPLTEAGTDSSALPYRSPLLDLPGAAPAEDAVPAAAASRGVAWHYGAPFGEQRLLRERGGRVVVDRSHRVVLSVAGVDAADFLNRLFSQKLDDLPDGATADALDLDAQGRIQHLVTVTRHGDEFLLDAPAEQAAGLRTYLDAMVFWSQVTISVSDRAILTVLGGDPSPSGAELLPDAAGSDACARAVDWAGPTRVDLLVPRDRLLSTAEALRSRGIQPAGLMTFTAERVRACYPEPILDLDDKAIPHEIPRFIGRHGRRGAVHLSKGCYRGQETVARVENLGRPPRLLALLQLDGSAPELPRPGAEIAAGGRRVGRLGTVVQDCADGPIALGLIKRSALRAEGLAIGPVAALVDREALPAAEDEAVGAGREAVNRLRGRA